MLIMSGMETTQLLDIATGDKICVVILVKNRGFRFFWLRSQKVNKTGSHGRHTYVCSIIEIPFLVNHL